MGRATRLLLWAHAESSFQSTPSVGRATRCADWDNRHHKISIHALRGEGDSAHLGFNIHIDRFQSTPSVGRATRLLLWAHAESSFQSTPSVGRATRCADWDNRHHKISIHALRGEGDSAHLGFNIHIDRFQSTPSVGRATNVMLICLHHILISIHALRGEGDLIVSFASSSLRYFNPRPPWGGRLNDR